MLEPGARAADLIGVVESAGADVMSTSVSDEPDARRVTLLVSTREQGLVDLVDRFSDSSTVRQVSLDS